MGAKIIAPSRVYSEFVQQEDLLYVIENDDSDTGLQPLSNFVLYLLQNPFEREL